MMQALIGAKVCAVGVLYLYLRRGVRFDGRHAFVVDPRKRSGSSSRGGAERVPGATANGATAAARTTGGSPSTADGRSSKSDSSQALRASAETQPGDGDEHNLALDEGTGRYEVTLMPVVDANFAGKNFVQLYGMQCYARKHGYRFELLNLNSPEFQQCNAKYQTDFFFRKHCAVAQVLKARQRPLDWYLQQEAGASSSYPPNLSAKNSEYDYYFVVDSDMALAGAELKLDSWIEQNPADVTFYERSWNFEVMAGNYIVRNTPFATEFLERWAAFYHRRPPGFSSSDQGAIHQLLVETLHLQGADRCNEQYRKLTASVMDLKPYFAFVSCTKKLLGPPRDWATKITLSPVGGPGSSPAAGSGAGKRQLLDGGPVTAGVETSQPQAERSSVLVAGRIRVTPRWHGFAADGVYAGSRCSAFHVFHHGVKGSREVGTNYPQLNFRIDVRDLLKLLSSQGFGGSEVRAYDFLTNNEHAIEQQIRDDSQSRFDYRSGLGGNTGKGNTGAGVEGGSKKKSIRDLFRRNGKNNTPLVGGGSSALTLESRLSCTETKRKCPQRFGGKAFSGAGPLTAARLAQERRELSEMILGGESWLFGSKSGDHAQVIRWSIRDCLMDFKCAPLGWDDPVRKDPFAGGHPIDYHGVGRKPIQDL